MIVRILLLFIALFTFGVQAQAIKESYAFAGKTSEFYVAGDACLLSFETLQGGPGGDGANKADGQTTHGTIRHAVFTGYTAACNL